MVADILVAALAVFPCERDDLQILSWTETGF